MNWYARNIALPLILFLRDNWPWLLRLVLPGYQPPFPQEDEDQKRFDSELLRKRAEWKAILGKAAGDGSTTG